MLAVAVTNSGAQVSAFNYAYDPAANPLVKEVANHVARAQAGGKPGAPNSGRPLHRITDPDQIKANMRAACGSVDTGTLSCDEYPLASSREGGAGASTEAVPLASNNSQGGIMSSFYQAQRVLDQDVAVPDQKQMNQSDREQDGQPAH